MQSEDTNLVFLKTVDLTGGIYSDKTGWFPITSRKGNKYILVAYNYDSNTIHAEPLKTRTGIELKTLYHKLYSLLTNRGLKSILQIMDYECPNVLKTSMREINENFKLVPTYIYHRNSSERAIRIFKEHFISDLASTHKDFQLHLWSGLLPHVSLTLNLLRKLRTNPNISGYSHIHGEFNYNTTPLAPPNTQIIVHEKPTVRGTWAAHGVKGWYIGPYMEHYRCHHIYITKIIG